MATVSTLKEPIIEKTNTLEATAQWILKQKTIELEQVKDSNYSLNQENERLKHTIDEMEAIIHQQKRIHTDELAKVNVARFKAETDKKRLLQANEQLCNRNWWQRLFNIIR